MQSKHAILMTLICALATPAFGGTIWPSGSGTCSQYDGCSTWAPNVSNSARNWFAFDIPAGGTITAATLWVSPFLYDRVDDPTRTYTLYQPSSISYDGLADGPALGSTGVQDISQDAFRTFWYHVPLNETGLALLNASQGTRVFLGGAVDAYDPEVIVSLFNYPPGTCNAGGTVCVGAPYLDVAVASTSATPEPGTWILILGGICLLPAIRRRGRRPNLSHT